MNSDPYELLGLLEDCTIDEIRRAYHEAARKLHPDVNKSPGETELFLDIQEAYNLLSDPDRRAAYDAKRLESSPIAVKISASRTRLPILSEAQFFYTLLEISPLERIKVSPHQPLNIALVIDRSTSMQGERMDMVKAALINLVQQMKPDDLISIVLFSDRAEVLLSGGHYQEKNSLEHKIHLINTSGGTEIYHGLQAGFQELLRHSRKTNISHLILFTDGHTYGDENACLTLAERAAENGVRITAIGIGHDWNDAFLDELTLRSGGICIYVSRPVEINNLLQDRLRQLNLVFAEQTLLHLTEGSGVKLNAVMRLRPDPAPLSSVSPIHLGSIPDGSGVAVLLEFIVSPLEGEPRKLSLAVGEIVADIPSTSGLHFHRKIQINCSTAQDVEVFEPPKIIREAVLRLNLNRLQDKAHQEIQSGDYEKAGSRLEHLATRLFSQGRQELARTILFEAEQIKKTHTISLEGEKQIKFGTRSLFLLPEKLG